MGVVLVNNIPKVIPLLKEQVAVRVNNVAQIAVARLIAASPIDTGFLRSHLGQTTTATPNNLSAEVRSLAPYSGPTDTGVRGTLWWTNTWLGIRSEFPQLMLGKGESAGPGVIRAAMQEFHGVLGRKGGRF